MTRVPREVLDREQIDEPQVDLAKVGVGSDFVEIEPGSDSTGTFTGTFEFGDHIGYSLIAIDNEACVTRRRTAAAFALGHSAEDVLEPDSLSDRRMLEQPDRGGHRRNEAAPGIDFQQPAHGIDQFSAVAV
ncbi:hypothetical protein MTY66_48170 [Mycolicibacterium sp. TY66]|nr:hypothetical protein MTY66_48170 [Mycolicibacterium sp. TY66]BCJ79162.1 hypothetical protein MTY81_05350 [Mycolicibacterium sp. TY81]